MTMGNMPAGCLQHFPPWQSSGTRAMSAVHQVC
jgi:hypothetical protein